jgi:hypothetical protein
MRRDQFYASAWYPALEGAGMPRRFKFHSLRHHAASAMLAAGADIAQVAAHLGDTVETVARVYVHFLRDREDALAELVERALGTPESEAAADSWCTFVHRAGFHSPEQRESPGRWSW